MSLASHETGIPTDTGEAPRPRLAVVEDDAELREQILLPVLRAAGFDATGLDSALQLYRSWAGSPFNLVLLDIGLPEDDGVEIARHLRGLSPSPGIVIYTGHERSLDRLRGLRAGVDAYLVKPLDMDEVVETLRNVHARLAAPAGQVPHAAVAGCWSLDRRGWSLTAPSGSTVSLSQAERQVMALLVASRDAPVSREVLIAHLTGDVESFDPRRLEMLVYRLRQKCRQACGEDLPLRTVRGTGYLFQS